MLKEWKKQSTNCKLATFTLLFMSTQFIALEGRIMSTPKILFMAICPILALWRGISFSKAAFFSGLFLCFILLLQLGNLETFRYSTHVYTLLFIFVFHLYYSLIWVKKSFSLDYFIKLIEFVFMGYLVFLIIQQIGYMVGVQPRILNCVPEVRGRFSSLNVEPSTTARMLTVYFYAYLKCNEYKLGHAISPIELWRNHRKVLLIFLYSMLTMASGTAIVCLALLATYFMRPKYAAFVIPFVFGVYLIAPHIENEAVQRAYNTFNAAITMDQEMVFKNDTSSAARVNVLLDTIQYTDLTNPDMWLGHGSGSTARDGKAVVLCIYEYGFISYCFKLVFYFACCFTSIFCFEVLFLILLLGMDVGNIVYGWAILMVFSTVKYFKKYRN